MFAHVAAHVMLLESSLLVGLCNAISGGHSTTMWYLALLQANSSTNLPVTWLPLSQYATYFEEVMRFRGYSVRCKPPIFCRRSLAARVSVNS